MKYNPNQKPEPSPIPKQKSTWWALEIAIFMVLPSIEGIEQNIITSFHSGVFNLWLLGEILGLCLLAIGLFLGFNENHNKIKKLAKWTSERPKSKYVPIIGIVMLIAIRLTIPALGDSYQIGESNPQNAVHPELITRSQTSTPSKEDTSRGFHGNVFSDNSCNHCGYGFENFPCSAYDNIIERNTFNDTKHEFTFAPCNNTSSNMKNITNQK